MKARETPAAVYCPDCGYRLARIVELAPGILSLDWPRGWYRDVRGDGVWRRGRARRTRAETTEGGDRLIRYPSGAPVECPRCREVAEMDPWPRILPSN